MRGIEALSINQSLDNSIMNDDLLLEVTNPSSGSSLAQLAMDDLEGAQSKVTIARSLFDDKPRHLPLHERLRLLESLASTIEKDHEEFSLLIAEEGGKPLRDAAVEVTRAIGGIRNAIATVSEHRGNVIPMGHQASSAGRIAVTQSFPRGVVLAFSAFNHPLNLIVHQIIPAFATGCPCVVKPAPDTPLSCLKLVAAMHEAGVPEDYISCVVTNDLEVADALVRSPKIAFFSFIGSGKVGWMLRSKLYPGVRCALEHGGVAPCIVSASADLTKAIPAISKGGFYHAGQVCVSTQRVYVDNTIYPEFVEGLTKAVNNLVVGDATEATTDVGPLIRAAEATRVHQWILGAIAEGAILAAGGSAPEGNFLAPTLLLSPPSDAKVSAQEIFGPVVCVYPVESFEESLSLVNSAAFAFQASIFTENLDEVYRAYDHFMASAIMVNDHTAFRDDVMPFAGLNESGLGVGGIPYTIEDMQFEKMLVLNKN
jgi:acyl-CoA reductase-like NAD-dependent aldehyde dehydrogenase